MIERMKESIPYDQVTSRNNNAVWLGDELFECLDAQIESPGLILENKGMRAV